MGLSLQSCQAASLGIPVRNLSRGWYLWAASSARLAWDWLLASLGLSSVQGRLLLQKGFDEGGLNRVCAGAGARSGFRRERRWKAVLRRVG